jgi:hypothetical protein
MIGPTGLVPDRVRSLQNARVYSTGWEEMVIRRMSMINGVRNHVEMSKTAKIVCTNQAPGCSFQSICPDFPVHLPSQNLALDASV